MIRKKQLLCNIIDISIVIFISLMYFVLNKNPNIIFFGNILFCVLICFRAKFSLYSIKMILIDYVLISVFFQYNFNVSYGVLQNNLYDLNYTTINALVFIYSLIINFYLINSNFLKIEKEKQTLEYEFSKRSCIILSIIAIIFSIVAFPHIGKVAPRFDSLLPGNGWNHVVIISLLLLLPVFNKYNFVKFSYAFCIFWFLIQGERVDMIGLIFCLIIILGTKKLKQQNKNKILNIVKYAFLFFLIFFIMIFIGERRAGNKNLNMTQLIQKVLIQNTAADVGHVYNVSILYRKDHGLLYGKSYLEYIKNAIPMFPSNTIDKRLEKEYFSPGGAFLLSEPYMNFGVIGVIIFAISDVLIIGFITKRKTKYSYFLYLYIFAAVFRTSWYGLWYMETGIIYILPILYIIANNIGRSNFINEKKSNFNNSSNI